MIFEEELRSLLNRYSIENESDTPDFILVDFILGCLNSYNTAMKERDAWHGFAPWGRRTLNFPEFINGSNQKDTT